MTTPSDQSWLPTPFPNKRKPGLLGKMDESRHISFRHNIYIGPFVPAGGASMDSTNHGLKIFEKNIPESFRRQNLNFPHINNKYLQSIVMVQGISNLHFSNLEIVKAYRKECAQVISHFM